MFVHYLGIIWNICLQYKLCLDNMCTIFWTIFWKNSSKIQTIFGQCLDIVCKIILLYLYYFLMILANMWIVSIQYLGDMLALFIQYIYSVQFWRHLDQIYTLLRQYLINVCKIFEHYLSYILIIYIEYMRQYLDYLEILFGIFFTSFRWNLSDILQYLGNVWTLQKLFKQ